MTLADRLDREAFDLDLSPYRLAEGAQCASPDTSDSDGAVFLKRVQDSANEVDFSALVEALQTHNGDASMAIQEFDETIWESADSDVPIYTHTLWKTFVDLAAYQEDDESGTIAHHLENGGSLENVASTALFQIARRLLHSLVEDRLTMIAEHVEELSVCDHCVAPVFVEDGQWVDDEGDSQCLSRGDEDDLDAGGHLVDGQPAVPPSPVPVPTGAALPAAPQKALTS